MVMSRAGERQRERARGRGEQASIDGEANINNRSVADGVIADTPGGGGHSRKFRTP
jgi:hypothetical protein